MNELVKEKSPYLLQHKNNPVWWKSWSERTIKRAQEENKLILLSIGYATCHWCHVMEHESFEDQEVAQTLNSNYISIKVDREELPDVDQIYMEALQALGQRGGWPLNMILTPDLKPIYGGTYFPKHQFLRVLNQISEMWKNDSAKLIEPSKQLYDFLQETAKMTFQEKDLPSDLDEILLQHFESIFDVEYGGFGRAPKFPPNTQIPLLLRLNYRTQKSDFLAMASATLMKMANGGIYDHIGGGFTRYSVDERWEIPHFEKMLYVNALSTLNYLEVYQSTQKTVFLKVAEDVLQYVIRDMLSSKSGFYSAEDADSEGEEGAFYVWTFKELKEFFNKNELKFLVENLGVTESGNFEGKNHFTLKLKGFEEVHDSLEFLKIREKLLSIREERERPLLDDKQLTSWNALMITALTKAYLLTQKKVYLESALQAMNFIKSTLTKSSQVFRRYRDGDVRYLGTLEDYAYLIQSLIMLYSATFEEKWLLWSYELQEEQEKLFSAETGYFYTALDEKNLIVRKKDFTDHALPNSNGIAAQNLIHLGFYFERVDWLNKAEKMIKCVGQALDKYPSAFSTLLVANELLQNAQQLVVSQSKNSNLFWRFQLEKEYHPHLIIGVSHKDTMIPLLKNKETNLSHDLFYLCRNGACEAPALDINQLISCLHKAP